MADAAEWGWFAGAVGVALAGGLVWARTHSLLQHVVLAAGVAGAFLLALPLVPFDGPAWGAGAVLVAVALVWGGTLAGQAVAATSDRPGLGALGSSPVPR